MDDNSPATKGELHREIQRLEEKMDEGFRKVNEGIDQVLTVVVNMDKRFTGKVEDHEKRITRLEKVAA